MKKLLLTLMFVNCLNIYAQNPVQEFNFNGNLNSADNTISFLGTAAFVNDRMGAAKGALRLTNKAFQAVVGDLPQGNKPRTISVWVKFNAVTAPHHIWGYGTAVSSQYFGLSQQASAGSNSDLSLIGWETANNATISVPLAKEVWYHYSVTYDGNISKIYRNGELLKTVEGIPRLTKGYILTIGKMNTTTSINADIDDLKLYSVAMTDEQVLESYNSSKPSNMPKTAPAPAPSNEKTVTAALVKTAAPAKAPAPVTTAITATPDTNNYTKNVEVFSQGKQIMGANASNIDDLPEGTYLLKITKKAAKK
ncbi:LamG domain-containing protein [Flavobacterium hungaricum]|uniref:LamG domain-containing protein n=1 Tax=Flavobacterium hungaricum TaxID=2082725 RepID=A0ABR9TF58_9FLAO|nr:LamG domain-containing protein [Flavobacterium hungaricum]MBE8723983.1 LamG domain-containing protein [Flavobacterium hungaricum]